jgi:RHS repeat-associated protein
MVAATTRDPEPVSPPPLPSAAIPSPVSVSWPRTGSGNKAFTGREWDPETGLYYYRARYYDPKLGRFVSEDPIKFLGGANFYAYVENSPTTRRDPSGLGPWDSWHHKNPPSPCPAAYVIGAKAFGVMKQHGTRFTHCWASCEIAKACGQKTAEYWQDTKEWYDWAVCGLPGFSKNCDSAFQPDDYYDNQTGRSCPTSQSCWDRCRPLMGAPDPPPGPYGE